MPTIPSPSDRLELPTSSPLASDLDLTIAFVGAGGDGVITAGEVLMDALARRALHVHLTKSYGPQIRGGESLSRLRLGSRPVRSHADRVDLLVVLSLADAARFSSELTLADDACVLLDEGDPLAKGTTLPDWLIGERRQLLRLPLTELSLRKLRNPQAKNLLALGAVAALCELPLGALAEKLERKLGGRKPLPGSSVVSPTLALELGSGLVGPSARELPVRFRLGLAVTDEKATQASPLRTLTGNEALCLGALEAGLRFFAGYPITPASDLMELLERQLFGLGGTAVQAEDEIAAAGMALGAAYGGVPAMTATSGPGFSLMQETLGLASMAEVPLVVVDVQRCGPATGIPTKTEQADLLQACFGAHGDAPRLVLAPRDLADCFQVGAAAIRLAQAYQTPVVVLSDQSLGQRKETVAREALVIDEGLSGAASATRQASASPESAPYRRFAFTDDGVSPLCIPGTPSGAHTVAGIEHDELGQPSSSPEVHDAMSQKRARKLVTAARDVPLLSDVRVIGARDGAVELAVLAWGSTLGPLEEALEALSRRGVRARGVLPLFLWPLPTAAIERQLDGARRLVCVELSSQGQLLYHLRAHLSRGGELGSYRRAGGRPFGVGELVSALSGAVAVGVS